MPGPTQRRARLVKVGDTKRLIWIKRSGEDDGEIFSFSSLLCACYSDCVMKT